MKSLKLLAALALCIGVAGCDTTDFTEDFDDAQLLPTYVAFDSGQLTAQGWTFTAAQSERGSFRQFALPGNATAATNLTGLRVRLPEAIEENVTVTYGISGTAEYGRDYRLYVMNANAEWVETPPTGQTGQIDILYSIENPSAVEIAPHTRDLRVAVLPGAQRNVDLRIELQSATTAGGQQLTLGRLPDVRDRVVTLRIVGTPLAAGSFADCPAELEIGEEGAFAAVINATATRPVSFAWTFGDGATATTQQATHTYSAAGTYTASVVITNPLGSVTRTCTVEVVAADDDENGDEE